MERVICRLCMQLCNSEQSAPLQDIIEVVTYCVSIKIEENDGLPSTVCESCKTDALIAYNFKKRCEETDKQLRCEEFRFLEKTIKCEQDSTEELENSELPERSPESEPRLEEPKFLPELLHRCRFCDLAFSYKKCLDFHERKHDKGFKCYICEKEFVTPRQLTNHINIHSRKGNHLCQICGKQFTLPENLVRHQRIHSGLRPYKCTICERAFTQSGDLKTHMYTHSTEKSYLCSSCGKKFARQVSLKIHIRRMHSSMERSHICPLCSKPFKDKRDLNQHMLIHSGERKHVCTVCNKAFNRSSNLRVHERIHTGCKPFECNICHKRFIQKHVLMTHLNTHPAS